MDYNIIEATKTQRAAKVPTTKVPKVYTLYPVFTSIPENWVNIQKPLSLAWETTMAPAPIADTTKALSISEVNPRVASKGAMIEAVVMRATVDDPWAVFIAAP